MPLSKTQKLKLPIPSDISTWPNDAEHSYWKGVFHGLQVNGVCVTCDLVGRRSPVTVLMPKIVPTPAQLKWLPQHFGRYWRGYHVGKALAGRHCFECIRETYPSSRPARRPLVTIKDFRKQFAGTNFDAVGLWRQYIVRWPFY